MGKTHKHISFGQPPLVSPRDFNGVTHSHEKIGANTPKDHKMRAYNDFMNSCNLIDLGFIGSKFK